jgi:hypothetical protein
MSILPWLLLLLLNFLLCGIFYNLSFPFLFLFDGIFLSRYLHDQNLPWQTLCSLCLQENSAASIFTGQEEIFAFDRTVSRLSEMQTADYWEQWYRVR